MTGRGRLPTAQGLVERIALGWLPGHSRPRRRSAQSDLAGPRRPPTAEDWARPAATRIVIDFAPDGTVMRGAILTGPNDQPGPWGGPWPCHYPDPPGDRPDTR